MPQPITKPHTTTNTHTKTLTTTFLKTHKLIIIEHNWRRRCGEIDLIARDGGTLVFVEVRLRRSRSFGGAAASIHAAKRARLVATAGLYLARLPGSPPCRFDVVLLDALAVDRIQWLRDVIST